MSKFANIKSFNWNAYKAEGYCFANMGNIENAEVKFIGENDKDKLKPSQS